MADNVVLNPGTSGDVIAADDISGVKHQLVKVEFGSDGAAQMVDATHGMPVSLVNLAAPVPVTDNGGSLTVDDGGSSLTVDGSVSISNFPGTQAVTDSAAETSLASILAKLTSDPATQTTLAAILAKLDVALSTRLKPADTLAGLTSITNVVHVDDNAGALSVDDNGGSLTVDGVFFQATQPISNSNFDAALSTLAKESGGNLASILTAVNSLDAGTPAGLGQTTKSASMPVVLSSDQIILLLTGAATQTAVVNNILPASSGSSATDVSQYRSFAIQVISTGTGGTFIFEGSVDNVNFVAITVNDVNLIAPVPVAAAITATASNKIYTGACQFPYLRLRIATTITGGSIQAFSAISPNPLSTTQMTIAQGSAGNLNAFVVVGINASYANGTAFPTTGIVRGAGMLSNGTTLDTQHGNWNTTTGDTGAKTAGTFNGATQTNFDSKGCTITALLGTISGTFTTFQFQLQYSHDDGTNWTNFGAATTNDTSPTSGDKYVFQIYPGVSSLTSGGKQTISISGVLPRKWRVTLVVAGSSPSATLTAIYLNYNM